MKEKPPTPFPPLKVSRIPPEAILSKINDHFTAMDYATLFEKSKAVANLFPAAGTGKDPEGRG